MPSHANLVELFKQIASKDSRGITFITDDNTEDFMSYGELYDQAISLLGQLQAAGIEPGAVLVFQIERNEHFVPLFWACILGGVVPVPIAVGSNDEHRLKLLQIWKLLRSPYLAIDRQTWSVLTQGIDNGARFHSVAEEMQKKTVFTDDLIWNNHSISGVVHNPDIDDLALIQFSSSSTGDPKGIMLSHRNLIANIDRLVSLEQYSSEQDSCISWLPLTHHFGNIAFHMVPLAAAVNLYLMPTPLFIRSPILWMKKASEHKITYLSSPNFGFKHFLDFYRPEFAKGWDLSHVRKVSNGAEPTSSLPCLRFMIELEKHGLRFETMKPTYGMAEACVGTTAPLDVYEPFSAFTLDQRDLKSSSSLQSIENEDKVCVIPADFNATEASYPQEKTVHALFEEQAERTPEREALASAKESWTYRELNERANRLAHQLRDIGVGRGQPVGIMAERSVEMVAGIFAILKAGGAYVPLDPSYPSERLAYMAADSGMSVLLTQRHLGEKLAFGGLVVDLEDEALKHGGRTNNPEPLSEATDLAYMIYTSGTTGNPKGVMIQHRSVVNRLWWMQEKYPLEESDVIMQKTPVSFDVSVWELFWWSWFGGKLFLLGPGEEKDPRAIAETVQRERVTVMHFVPSMLSAFTGYLNSAGERFKLTSLKQVFTSGEALKTEQVSAFYRHVPEAKLSNLYGPTEATVDVTFYDCRPGEERTAVPIGKPIANTGMYVVDAERRMQPIGVAGELCISGVGLARGYYNREELTAEKFVDCPFILEGKMYRTGDLARWLPDGNLEYLGRMDQQVKIRGFRIELGEIESAMLRHAGVKEAAAAVVGDDDQTLCGYYTSDHPIRPEELKELLALTLPEHMIPPYFMRLEQMPLSPSGKLNRKALPEPAGDIRSTGEGEVSSTPQSEIERKLASIWEEVLRVEKVGLDDNFFELGGHSLKAVAVVSRIYKELQVELELNAVFRYPTVRGLAELAAGANRSVYANIQPVAKRAYYPVSSAQKRLLILQQLEEGSTSYNMPGVIRIEGELEAEWLETAFQRLIERHESLRTSFAWKEGEPIQRVEDSVAFQLERAETADAQVQVELGKFVKPFNIGRAPLIRAKLVKSGEQSYLLLYDMHHLISDGMSMLLLEREFLALYEGNALPPLRIHYKDYSAWQQELFASEAMKRQGNYWRERFAEEVPVLALPTDYPRPPVFDRQGDWVRFTAGEQLTERLNRLAGEQGATMFMVLLAGYHVLLSKYTGQQDIVIGSPTAGRRHDDLERLIGMFVHTLALRNRTEPWHSFADIVGIVKENALQAFENQDYPFEELVDQVEVKRDFSRNPLFDTMFVLQSMMLEEPIAKQESAAEKSAEKWPSSDVSFHPEQLEGTSAKFDLLLAATESGGKIHFQLNYWTRLFTRASVERMGQHLLRILEQAVMYPERKFSEMTLLDERERLAVTDIHSTEASYPREKTVHVLFEEQAERTPESEALVSAKESLTYRKLNERANRLAHQLREMGVGRGQPVGIMAERSTEMVAGIIAILKAGGAYVPLDPSYPAERLAYMAGDSGMSILLTQRHLREKLAFGGLVVELELELELEDEALQHGGRTDNPEPLSEATDLAYIIYTSGTTGNPKGVMIEHRSVVNLVHGLYGSVYAANESKLNIALLAPISFDASVQQLFPALLGGHALHIVPDDTRRDGIALLRFYNQYQIDVSDGTPSHLKLLVASHQPGLVLRARQFIIGGEALTTSTYEQFKSCYPNASVTNVYGPTECCVDATFYPVHDHGFSSSTIPIGRPLANTRIFIVDANGALLPPHLPGELCISGDGVARGYYNREELTAEKFVDCSFIPEGKMYRTGDLARWLPDGNLEYLGRMDQQVKIRGFRIELGEIESAMLWHDEVKEAAAAVVGGEDGALCGYYTSEQPIRSEELKELLARKLPEHMIPPYFVQLEKMPLTPNGKLDRKALEKEEIKLIRAAVPPSNEEEALMADIWMEVLNLHEIGVTDDFFELGGQSIKAMSIIAKIQQEYGIMLPISFVFQYKTIKELVAKMKGFEQYRMQHEDGTPILLNEDQGSAVFCFPSIFGFGFEFKGLSRMLNGYSVYAFDFIEDEMRIQRYANHIMRIQPNSPYVLIGYSAGGNLAFETAKELERRGAAVSNIILLDSYRKEEIHFMDPNEAAAQVEEWSQKIEGERYSEYMNVPLLKHDIFKKVTSYLMYYNELINEGTVSCTIHHIRAIRKHYEETWSEATSGRLIEYQGSGFHLEMLQGEGSAQNSVLVQHILEQIIPVASLR
ncbi:amino acid adenylation domain-containing protein [Paenibacillus sp. GCM10027627]|uniref:amino acid adenylation domain-containing protein n=1 Tax=unclassified Paenibacillus TaxID=185978 RepID=UPI00364458FF